jgi:TolB-like protein
MTFFTELKRRNVIRVGILYLISAWLLLQLTDVLSSLLPVPEWTGSLVIVLLAIGFFPTLAFAWVFELTSEGLKRESEIDHSVSLAASAEQRTNVLITVLLIIAIGSIAVDRLVPENSSPVNQTIDAADLAASPAMDSDSAVIDKASIAVLPFADLSPQQDQQYFTDGISEELLNVLVRVDGLRVASRTSSFGYRNTSLNVPTIGEELKVRHILEGSVRKDEQRIRITAQLIDAGTDKHLWSETYDRELSDVFAIQDEIANAIVDALGNELGLFDRPAAITYVPGTENLDAYEVFLKAQASFMERIRIDESVALYEQAVVLDPNFARAWEGLAAAEVITQERHNSDSPEYAEATKRAEEAAHMAIELNPDLSLAYAVLGSLQETESHDLVKAAELYDVALKNDPRNSTVLLWRGLVNLLAGYVDEAIVDMRACLEVDPAYLNCMNNLSLAYFSKGDLETGFQLVNTVLQESFWLVPLEAVSFYVEAGNPLIAAAILDTFTLHQRVPTKYFIFAAQNPGEEDPVGLDRVREWADGKQGMEMAVGLYAFLSRHYEEPAIPLAITYSVWSQHGADYRKSQYFRQYVREKGLLAYWQKKGFPPQCEPVGDDDFRCD